MPNDEQGPAQLPDAFNAIEITSKPETGPIEPVHDELALKKKWMEEARGMTAEKLPAFIKKLSEFPHDYGTICRAIAAAAIGAAWSVERSPQGGITGFQASCVIWDLITGWDSSLEDKPLCLLKYEKMLYPQHENDFTSISKDTWAWLQKEAKKNLAENQEFAHPNVLNHWNRIVEGHVPFGYLVAED